jgi:hypothetical protein
MISYNSLDVAFGIPESTYTLLLQDFRESYTGYEYLPGTLSCRRNPLVGRNVWYCVENGLDCAGWLRSAHL